MEDTLQAQEEKSPEKHYTTIEWETDVERVRVVFYVERFPKKGEPTPATRTTA